MITGRSWRRRRSVPIRGKRCKHFTEQRVNGVNIFFAFGEEPFRPKDRGKMEDRSAMTRDDRPNDPHSLKRHPFSLSPPENGGSSTLSFQLFDLYPPYPARLGIA